jgi:3-dehydroquinate synthase
MSEIFNIHSSLKSYPVLIDTGNINSFLEDSHLEIIIDQKVHSLWPSLKVTNPILLEALEKNKTLDTVASLIESLREKSITRSSCIIAIGGGIVQDLSTFSASSYMRGIKWIYAPTTLLGMMDSCIGGKSSINVGKYKNIAGNFYPPEKIIIDVNFCQTLNEQQLVEGLCEAAKICYAYSFEQFNLYLSKINIDHNLHQLDFVELVTLSLKTKQKFIEEDEFDNGIRLLLNFGHTFGHALEGASNFLVSHGIGVGLGIIAAYKMSLELGLISHNIIKCDNMLQHINFLLSKVENLSTIVDTINMEEALIKFKSDKKHEKHHFIAILYDEHGKLIRHKFAKTEATEQMILNAFNALKENTYEI